MIVNEEIISTYEKHVDQSEQSAKIVPNKKSDNLQVKATDPIITYVPFVPFLRDCKKRKLNEHFAMFLDIFRKLYVNIPLIEAISQILSYAIFFKGILSKKRKLIKFETIKLN